MTRALGATAAPAGRAATRGASLPWVARSRPITARSQCWVTGAVLAVACGGSTFEGPALDGGGGFGATDGSAGTAGSGGSGGGSGGSGAGGSGGQPAGGGAGTSGTGGTPTGGAGGAGGACPGGPPTTGSSCAPEGLRCTYPGECWAQSFVCQAGAWWEEPSPGPPQPTCAAFEGNPPTHGESCKCLGWLDCTYDLCETQRGRVHAVCQGSTWEVAEGPCPIIACGADSSGTPLSCKPGEVCVRTFAGPGAIEECATSPCAPGALDCWCAAQLCGGSPYVCSGAEGGVVTCDCPVCA